MRGVRSVSRIERASTSRRDAIGHLGTKYVSPPQNEPTIVAPLLTHRFAAVILPFSCKQLAIVADCSPETVKAWRKGRQKPQVEHLFRMALQFPAIRKFVEQEIGTGTHPSDPRIASEIDRRIALYMEARNG